MPKPTAASAAVLRLAAIAASLLPATASASMFKGETLDSVAMGIAWFVIVVMPIAGIVLFWIVHVMPEKIAHKRHHPQRDAIHVLCLLSLFFGGLLWPIAWLWAYSRPTLHRLAYGTDRHEDYFVHMADLAEGEGLSERELGHLRHELDTVAERGGLTPELREARHRLAAARPIAEPAADGNGAAASGGTA